MPPLFASKSPFFVPVRQKFSHPVHGLPHFPLWQAVLLFAEMFCRTGAFSLCCCTCVLCFADEKSFPQKSCIQSVEERLFFHMLKTLWRKFKSPALKPVLAVEFHTFHKVFHFLVRPFRISCVQFVEYKSEI